MCVVRVCVCVRACACVRVQQIDSCSYTYEGGVDTPPSLKLVWSDRTCANNKSPVKEQVRTSWGRLADMAIIIIIIYLFIYLFYLLFF